MVSCLPFLFFRVYLIHLSRVWRKVLKKAEKTKRKAHTQTNSIPALKRKRLVGAGGRNEPSLVCTYE
jgi:hypothetical protein